MKDEEAPFEESFRSNRSNDSLDPANLSIGHSEVSVTNLDSHSLLADASFEGDVLTGASFAPLANSSPRTRTRSGSGTPLDRSFEARSTPSLTPSRFNSPRSGSGSPFQRQLFKPASTSSLGSFTNRRASPHSPITREVIQERLLRRKSEEALTASRSRSGSPAPPTAVATSAPTPSVPAPAPAPEEDDLSREEDEEDEEFEEADVTHETEPEVEKAPAPSTFPLMARGHNPTHDGVLTIDPEPQPIDPPRPTVLERAVTVDAPTMEMDAKKAFEGLDLDFEHGFGLGEEGMSVSAGLASRAKHSSMHLGDVSALDKLMEDMAQGGGVGVSANTSVLSEGQSYASLRVEAVTEGVKAQTFSLPSIEHDDEGMGIDVNMEPSMSSIKMPTFPAAASSPSPPPPPPPKDAIRTRDELIKAKRREIREIEEDDFETEMLMSRPGRRPYSRNPDADDIYATKPTPAQLRAAGVQEEDDDLLGVTAFRSKDAPLAETINRELKKRENVKRSVSAASRSSYCG